MTAAVALPKTGFKFLLKVQEGEDVGAVYQLLPPRVTIGRGPDNNIVLRDPRISRSTAVIEFSMERITITDVSSRQSMMVNGHAMPAASISNGDVIRFGETELVFVVEAMALPARHGPHHPGNAVGHVGQQGGMPADLGMHPHVPAGPSIERKAAGEERAKKIKFYAIVAAILLVGIFLMTSDPNKKKADIRGLRTAEEIEAEIKSAEKRMDDHLSKRRFKTDEERTRYDEAQKHYLQGFRDYQKGQFGRAMKSFETARAIDTGHELAGRYYRLAEKRRDEMIALLILEGRRYREKNMFARCAAAFEKVLDAIPNKEDLKYKNAEAQMKECKTRQDDRFQPGR